MSNSKSATEIQELSKTYRASSTALTQSLLMAFAASQATRNLPSNRQAVEYWASVLFARMLGFGCSMHKLIPGSAANPEGSVYDFSSVAALCRSLFEAYISFLYLCSPRLSADEYRMRLRVIQLHDCTRRPEILKKIGDTPDNQWFMEQAAVLREDLQSSIEFKKLEQKRQADILKGRSATHLTQDEILCADGVDTSNMRGFYEFLSSHTHSYPFSYWRTPDHNDRGSGKDNPVDKGYIAMTAQFAASIMEAGTEQMRLIFSSVTQYPTLVIDWDRMHGTATESSLHIFGTTAKR